MAHTSSLDTLYSSIRNSPVDLLDGILCSVDRALASSDRGGEAGNGASADAAEGGAGEERHGSGSVFEVNC